MILAFSFSLNNHLRYVATEPDSNIFDEKIDNNQNYTNTIVGFKTLNMNNSFDMKHLGADIIDKTLTEDDFDNLYDLNTYSTKLSECNFNKKIIIERHNFLRAKHNASSLKWDNFLEQKAKDKAKILEKSNCPKFKTSEKQFGVLTYYGYGTIYTEEEIVNHFYEGSYNWKWKNFEENDFSFNFYDFTQIIWKSSQLFGCAKACCLNNQIWICYYNPPAVSNDINELKKNLNAPITTFEAGFN